MGKRGTAIQATPGETRIFTLYYYRRVYLASCGTVVVRAVLIPPKISIDEGTAKGEIYLLVWPLSGNGKRKTDIRLRVFAKGPIRCGCRPNGDIGEARSQGFGLSRI